jgi:hypothetical protein
MVLLVLQAVAVQAVLARQDLVVLLHLAVKVLLVGVTELLLLMVVAVVVVLVRLVGMPLRAEVEMVGMVLVHL